MTEKIIRSKFSIIGIIAILLAVGVVAVLTIGDSTVEATETEQKEQSSEVEKEEASEEEEVVPIPVEVVEVTSGVIASYISATANLVPEDQVKVLAEAEGRVAKLQVEEGDRVQAGQVMAALVRDEAEIELAKAELKATNARLAFERAGETRDQGLISAEAFDKLRMEHEVAVQEVAEAEWRLEKTVIRAPFTGRVTERTVTLGQHLRPGDELFSVADFDPLVARIYLPETDVLELNEGREVRISLAAGTSLDFEGRICRIAPVVDTATGTVKVTVEAIRPPAKVRPGAFVDIRIVREVHPTALLLPRESVIRELRSAHVFIAEDDQAVKRLVQLGLEENDHIEALSGVEEGDMVIVAGQGGLDEGQKIKTL
ncbi:MAG: efflux RND transporter periplasmic adaptor subunit [Thermoanaerobaculales bacterium]|nr:efflux RND transporter periplasmic adaptor subunit [Thermoanaerobaculales bacterium]